MTAAAVIPRPCTRCGERPEHISGAGKRRSWCSPCLNTYNVAWRANNAAAFLRARRNGHLVRKYGITLEQYETMLEAQGNACAICRRTEDEIGRSLPVDHDAETGAVRGILCSSCNRGIGQLGHDPARLNAAAAYLDRVTT